MAHETKRLDARNRKGTETGKRKWKKEVKNVKESKEETGLYPHSLKASQSPQRPQRSQRPHRFERLNLAAAEERGHIIHQRYLNDTEEETTTAHDRFIAG